MRGLKTWAWTVALAAACKRGESGGDAGAYGLDFIWTKEY